MQGRRWAVWLLAGTATVTVVVAALMLGELLADAPAEVNGVIGLLALIISVVTYAALWVVVRRARL
jgi:hypothetical protein